jgi:C_GCAxxG_C_C family probable redox protein
MDRAVARSIELFDSGYYCAESVLLAVAEEKEIQSDLIPKIASGFCSGLSRTCGMCGAVSGAVMAISLFTGRSSPDASLEENYALVQVLISRFQDRFGSIDCRQLIGCDLDTQDGQVFFAENDLIELCKQYTAEATHAALSLIEEAS